MKALIIYSWRGLGPEHTENITQGLKRGVEARAVEAVVPEIPGDATLIEALEIIKEVLFDFKPGDVVLYHGSSDPRVLRLMGEIAGMLATIQEVEGSVMARYTFMPYTTFVAQSTEVWEQLNTNETLFAGTTAFLEASGVDTFTEENVAEYIKETENAA